MLELNTYDPELLPITPLEQLVAGRPGNRRRNMNAAELRRRAGATFDEHIGRVGDAQWHLLTPCGDWDVHELVNHLAAENLWTPALLEGRIVDEVGDRFEGDVLGDDPKAAWRQALGAAADAVGNVALDRTVHLSYGDDSAEAYILQLFAGHLIHGWDLATAIHADATLDPALVEAWAAWFDEVEDSYREAGAIGLRPQVADSTDPQARLLARFGRTA